MKATKFQELNVYQAAFELQQELFEISEKFPTEEKYSLTDQMRRASRSIGANIVEAWRKRRYPAHFTSKLTDSDGEASETQHWITTAAACGYINDHQANHLIESCEQIGAMLGKMIQQPESWCKDQ